MRTVFPITANSRPYQPAPLDKERFVGMTRAQIRDQLNREAETQRADHEAKMANLINQLDEQEDILKRYQEGTATIEELVAFHQRCGHL